MSLSRFWRENALQYALAIGGPIIVYHFLTWCLAHYESTTSSDARSNRRTVDRLESILETRDQEAFEAEAQAQAADNDTLLESQSYTSRKSRGQRLNLTSYEQTIANEVIAPDDIPVTFEDIGGLDDIIADLQEGVIYPLMLPHLYAESSPLLTAPGGVLLFGPPGCGKTMLAKALAHESGAVFINLHISTLTEKWYGDSNKLVAAVFSLARKLAPAIIFIDEIDAVLGTRGKSGGHEASEMVKAEFMTHMDGLLSAEKRSRAPQRIMVLGATNRIFDIDEAILRRMPRKVPVKLPNREQRRKIFEIVLRDSKIDKTPDDAGNRRSLNMDFLVEHSEGMSGSGIKDLCREAVMVPVRELLQRRRGRGEPIRALNPSEVRGLQTHDFFRGPNDRIPSSKVINRATNDDDDARLSNRAIELVPEDDDEYETDNGSEDEKQPSRKR